ncbi:MAG: hypothetical protein GTO18_06610 [Anaerolineales bacterium]|nr:hypothetical protein [Anaerolineales bacterium]
MAQVISIHEYVLRPEVDKARFERAILEAREHGMLQLPGLIGQYFLRGIKGSRRGKYAAIWIYESRDSWEKLWGSPDYPTSSEEYPEDWKKWESELRQFLAEEPDEIVFTAYEAL